VGGAGIGLVALAATAAALTLGATMPIAGTNFRSTSTNGANTYAASAVFPDYASSVLADQPLFYHRMTEGTGTTSMIDTSPHGSTGVYGVATSTTSYFDVPGPAIGGIQEGVALNGVSGFVTTEVSVVAPAAFSVELWVKTTTTNGGKLIGFGDKRVALSTSYDRHIYLDSTGNLLLGVEDAGVKKTVQSLSAVNDGVWHHVVGTFGAGTLALYVDGALHASGAAASALSMSGFWRLGGDQLAGWPSQPPSNFVEAHVDELAVYPSALSATRVGDHFAARTTWPAYRAAVDADLHSLFWRLNEVDTQRAADTEARVNARGEYYLGPTLRAQTPGALAGTEAANRAVRFDGQTSAAHHPAAFVNPTTFTVELWFRTTTRAGGYIVGFGSSAIGASASVDRLVYLRNDGRLAFGLQPASRVTLATSGAYHDNTWHHLAFTLGPSGMKLYADGLVRVQSPTTTTAANVTGYWRLGYDDVTGWPSPPQSSHFSGVLDELAVYDTELSANMIYKHYAAGR
jgi:hypothetical protein